MIGVTIRLRFLDIRKPGSARKIIPRLLISKAKLLFDVLDDLFVIHAKLSEGIYSFFYSSFNTTFITAFFSLYGWRGGPTGTDHSWRNR